MLTKCANPLCSRPLHYLRDGKVYRVEIKEEPHENENGKAPFLVPGVQKRKYSVQHYWLCGDCMTMMTLHFDERGNLTVVPKAPKVLPAIAVIDSPGTLVKKAAAS